MMLQRPIIGNYALLQTNMPCFKHYPVIGMCKRRIDASLNYSYEIYKLISNIGLMCQTM